MLREKGRPHEYMVYPTLQTAWIQGKGLLLFWGLYFVELGAGLFLAATFFQNIWGQTAGWLISGALGGGCHFFFLGHPLRIYKAFRRPGKSWISRGLFIIVFFQIFAFIHLVLSHFSTPVLWVMVVADIAAIATVLYGGYEIADVKPIQTWNSSFFPIQMLARSFFIGLTIVLAMTLLSGFETAGVQTKPWLIVTFMINICLFALHLFSLGFEGGRERLSLSMMTKGNLKWLFYPWVIMGGMVVPLIVSVYAFAIGVGEMGMVVLLIPVILQVTCDLLLRYSFMRTGYYEGLFPVKPADFR